MRPPGPLVAQEIRQLCLTAKEIFMSQPNLLELEAPIKICGEHARPPAAGRRRGARRRGAATWQAAVQPGSTAQR